MGWFVTLSFVCGLCVALYLSGHVPIFAGLAVGIFLLAIYEALEVHLRRLR